MSSSNSKQERGRAAQVGFMMRAYRESFPRERGRRGISQNGLLRRMAEADPDYARRISHATVSRGSPALRPRQSGDWKFSARTRSV